MRVTRSVHVERPPEAMWPWLTEPERLRRWMKGLIAVEPVSEGAMRPGFRSRVRIQEGKRVSDYEEEILAWDPPRRLAIELWGGCLPKGMRMRYEYVVEPEGGGSRVTCTGDAEVRGFWLRLFAPLMKLFSGMQLASFFRRLKEEAEGEARPAPAPAQVS